MKEAEELVQELVDRNDLGAASLVRALDNENARLAAELKKVKAEADQCAEICSKAIAFRINDDFTIESRGFGAWVISSGSAVWNTFNEWEYEPRPSSRPDDFIARTRFSFAEAWRIATSLQEKDHG